MRPSGGYIKDQDEFNRRMKQEIYSKDKEIHNEMSDQ